MHWKCTCHCIIPIFAKYCSSLPRTLLVSINCMCSGVLMHIVYRSWDKAWSGSFLIPNKNVGNFYFLISYTVYVYEKSCRCKFNLTKGTCICRMLELKALCHAIRADCLLIINDEATRAHVVNEQWAWQMVDKFVCTFKSACWGSLCRAIDFSGIV